MIEGARRARFRHEPPDPVRIQLAPFVEDLERDFSFEPRIPRTVDLTHPAAPERRTYLVRAKASTRSEGHVGGILTGEGAPQRLPWDVSARFVSYFLLSYFCCETGAGAAETGRVKRAPIDAKKRTKSTTPIAIPTVRDMMVY